MGFGDCDCMKREKHEMEVSVGMWYMFVVDNDVGGLRVRRLVACTRFRWLA